MTCSIIPGWGWGTSGTQSWTSSLAPSPGGPLPTLSPFDIYAVGPCGPVSDITTYTGVTTEGDPTQFPVDAGVDLDQGLASGGTFLLTPAELLVGTTVPEDWTFECTVYFSALPPDFSNLANAYAYLGVSSDAGACAGLFFSRVGLLYTGSVHVLGGVLHIDTPLQPLPDSALLVGEGEYWTIRFALSMSTGALYLYVTPSSELLTRGPQLKYILPVIPSSAAAVVPPSQTHFLVGGTVSSPSAFRLNNLFLGTGLLLPALPPVANAGFDQTILSCEVLQLSGAGSFDAGGASLTYSWRLLDAPLGSQYLFDGTDGQTAAGALDGFTDKLYSPSAGVENALDAYEAGDTVVLAGVPYTLLGTGTDLAGFFLQVTAALLPDNLLTNQPFKLLRLRGINGANTVNPTFLPDLPGLFKFDLIVTNGSLVSLPSLPSPIAVDVVTSLVARGCTPDLSFLWNYFSDFWKLVADRDRLEVYFSALAQVAAAELLNLWQIDYSKSLRDIQRTVQRKWIHYDLLLPEAATQIEATTATAVFSGLESLDIPTAGLSGVAGTHLDLRLAIQTAPILIGFSGIDPVTSGVILTTLQAQLLRIDPRIFVRVLPNQALTSARIRIEAPFAIQVLPTSTCAAWSLSAQNGLPQGVGAAVGIQTYRCDRNLSNLGFGQGNFLVLDGVGYRVARVVNDATDGIQFQRLSLLDTLPVPASTQWAIAGTVTSPDLNFYLGLLSAGDTAQMEVANLTTGSLAQLLVPVLGTASSQPGTLLVDLTSLSVYLAQSALYAVYFFSATRRTYVPLDTLVSDIPLLQEFIDNTDDTQVLRRNVDYFLTERNGVPCLRFATATSPSPDVWQYQVPPDRMWAETTYLNNEPTIEGNFGIPAEFTLNDLTLLPPNVDYLGVVRGLWYIYFRGPKVANLIAGTQILLGLPFAETLSTVIELRTAFSSTSGRILLQDNATSVVRSYAYPAALSLAVNPNTKLPYAVGDVVQPFAPLTTGVEVLDYVNSPTWFQGYLEQGVFYEVEKYFKFLVRVNSAAFDLDALLFVERFIRRIKPTYTEPLFVVLGQVGDTTVSVSDSTSCLVTLRIEDGVCSVGSAPVFDAPRAATGGYQNHFDTTDYTTFPPTYPTAQVPVKWGYDKGGFVCPEDEISIQACMTTVAPGPLPMDSLFRYDLPVYEGEAALLTLGTTYFLPASPGLSLGTYTMLSAETLTNFALNLSYVFAGTTTSFLVTVLQNSTVVHTTTMNVTGATPMLLSDVISIPVGIGDVLEVRIQTSSGLSDIVNWNNFQAVLGVGVYGAYDMSLPAGTYCVFAEL